MKPVPPNHIPPLSKFLDEKRGVEARRDAINEVLVGAYVETIKSGQALEQSRERFDFFKKSYDRPTPEILGVSSKHVCPKEVEAVLLKVQNVADYVQAHGKEQGWDKPTTFTCARPPFPKTVLSYDVMVSAEATEDGKLERILPPKMCHATVSVSELSVDALRAHVRTTTTPDTILAWIDSIQPTLSLSIKFATEGMDIPGTWILLMDAQGAILSDDAVRLQTSMERKEDNPFRHEVNGLWAINSVPIVLATFTFMNCRNVEVIDNPPSRQQRRESERTGTPAPPSYKTLRIQPFMTKRIGASTGRTVSTEAEISLHIVRGHFKDYREGKGLGRAHVKGVYWWHPQLRGNEAKGRVVKDYEVGAVEQT